MNISPAIDFDADYTKVPMMIEADYNLPKSNHDEAVLRLAKIELVRLCKRIFKLNSNIRGKYAKEKDITELYQDILFNDILRL